MSRCALITILFVISLLIPLHAKELKVQPIDTEVIGTYNNLGAKYGGFVPNDDRRFIFSPGETAADKALPGFSFYQFRGKIPHLPPVRAPFGLTLAGSAMSDAELHQLRDLRYLNLLNLEN
jgi:hypothetical protein